MKQSGPDTLHIWIISAACCFINMMMFGMARLAGILFVASIKRFNVSRAKAAYPYTFLSFMRSISGPLVGFLGHRFGVRATTTLGALLGAIGAGSCYFAESIDTITVLWGVILGLGYGLGNILLPVSINQYFDKQRASASGISYSGACLGSFVLPPIVEILLNTYGLSGTFLFLSGFVLNCIPAALLLRKPKFEAQNKENEYDQNEKQCTVPDVKIGLYTRENTGETYQTIQTEKHEVETGSNDECYDRNTFNRTFDSKGKITSLNNSVSLDEFNIVYSSESQQIIENSTSKEDPNIASSVGLSFHNTSQDTCGKDGGYQYFLSSSVQCKKPVFTINRTRDLSSEDIVFRKGEINTPLKESHFNYGYHIDSDEVNEPHGFEVHTNVVSSRDITKSKNTLSGNFVESSINDSHQTKSENPKLDSNNFENSSNCLKYLSESADKCDSKCSKDTLSSIIDKEVSQTKRKSHMSSFSVIFDPVFILIAVTNAIYTFSFVALVTIIVDFARDLHIGLSNEKYVLMALSVGDLIGRLGLGWITDRGYMTTTGFAAFCFALQGISTAALVWSNGFVMLIILITIYGLSEGGIIIIFPIILAQYIDPDKQTVAISSSHFLTGPLCLAIAPMVGYFRDYIGAYDYIFYVVAILSAVCCLCMLLSPCIVKCQTPSRYQEK